MDTVTHALIGAVTARACTKPKNEKTTDHSLFFIAALAAAFPDIDYVLFWVNPYRFITEWHRGITHSLIMLPAWAALLSMAAIVVMKTQTPFRTVFGYCCLGLLTHIIADLFTLYGIQLFTPLNNQRFLLSLVFDFDPWIGLIALMSLVFGLNKRRNAVFGLAAIGAYLSLMLYFQQNATTAIDARKKSAQILTDKVYVLPQPFIPFHWKLVIDRQTFYETANISLFAKGTRLIDHLLTNIQGAKDHQHVQKTQNHFHNIEIADFLTDNQLEWQTNSKYGDTLYETDLALEVWRHHSFSQYRNFSSLAILFRIDNASNSSCVWYTDLRYVFPLLKPPFRYGMCRQHSNNDWQLYRLRRNTENIRQLIE